MSIDIYLATAEGLHVYDPIAHRLVPHSSDDLRRSTGEQDFVGTAPLELVYVADLRRMGDSSLEVKMFLAAADTGCITQNVSLFCASAGLGTVVRGWVDRPGLALAMGLRPEQRVILAQTVGYPRG